MMAVRECRRSASSTEDRKELKCHVVAKSPSAKSCRIRSSATSMLAKFMNVLMQARQEVGRRAHHLRRARADREEVRARTRSKCSPPRINNVQADGRSEVAAASAARTTRCRSKCARCAAWRWRCAGCAKPPASAARSRWPQRLANELHGSGGRPRRRDEEARRSAPHGRSQQGVLALPLLRSTVAACADSWTCSTGHIARETAPGFVHSKSRINHGPQDPHRALPQHRHLGAHRRRQDHDHRAHPVLHRREPQDRRSARRRRHHGLDGAGAGARHHDHVGRDDLLLEGHGRATSPSTASTSSTPRATSTSRSRSSARCACSTAPAWCTTPSAACSRSRKPSGARPTSTRCRASRSSTRWTAPAPNFFKVYDQMKRAPEGQPGADPDPDRRRRQLRGRGRPGQDEGDLLGRRVAGHEVRLRATSRPSWSSRRKEWREKMVEAAAEANEELMNKYLEEGDLTEAEIKRGAAPAHDRQRDRADAVRHRVQEQGRAGDARRRDRLPAVAGRHPAGRRAWTRTTSRSSRKRRRRRAVLGARVQDHDRPVRRPADLLPRVFGRA